MNNKIEIEKINVLELLSELEKNSEVNRMGRMGSEVRVPKDLLKKSSIVISSLLNIKSKDDILIYTTGPIGGDCTRKYEVQLLKPHTLKEFIDYILSNRSNEFGSIKVVTISSLLPNTSSVTYDVNYNNGKVINDIIDSETYECSIKNVVGHGCYGRIDYDIELYN